MTKKCFLKETVAERLREKKKWNRVKFWPQKEWPEKYMGRQDNDTHCDDAMIKPTTVFANLQNEFK